MPRGLNRVMLIGQVGNDPEVKSTPGGTTVANFSLATNDARKDASGAWVEQAEWHKISSFGKTADVVSNYVKKGSKLYIEGKLQTRSWEDKNGSKKYMTEVVANQIIMLDSHGKENKSGGNLPKSGGKVNNEPEYDEDAPF